MATKKPQDIHYEDIIDQDGKIIKETDEKNSQDSDSLEDAFRNLRSLFRATIEENPSLTDDQKKETLAYATLIAQRDPNAVKKFKQCEALWNSSRTNKTLSDFINLIYDKSNEEKVLNLLEELKNSESPEVWYTLLMFDRDSHISMRVRDQICEATLPIRGLINYSKEDREFINLGNQLRTSNDLPEKVSILIKLVPMIEGIRGVHSINIFNNLFQCQFSDDIAWDQKLSIKCNLIVLSCFFSACYQIDKNLRIISEDANEDNRRDAYLEIIRIATEENYKDLVDIMVRDFYSEVAEENLSAEEIVLLKKLASMDAM